MDLDLLIPFFFVCATDRNLWQPIKPVNRQMVTRLRVTNLLIVGKKAYLSTG
jgi:hypothetical protein